MSRPNPPVIVNFADRIAYRRQAQILLLKAAAMADEIDNNALPFAIAHAAAGLHLLTKSDPEAKGLDGAIALVRRMAT